MYNVFQNEKYHWWKFEFQISKDELLYSLETYQTAVRGSL
jgi:hypothetical protein